MAQHERTNTNIAVSISEMRQDIGYIKDDVKDIKDSMGANYVTKGELELVKQDVSLLRKIIFGFLGVVLVAFAGALVTVVLQAGAK